MMSRDMQCTPSSLARHFRQSTEAAQQGRVIDSTPPCNGCTACCRSSHMKAAILDHERADFPEAVYDDAAKRYVLPKRADGSCIHLVDDKCTVTRSGRTAAASSTAACTRWRESISAT